jgi:transcriptional regulator with XRE-family HTH domain
MQGDFYERLRKQIHNYRRASNITLAEMGAMINKSKTTVWKYENGGIDIDVKTLCEISSALKVGMEHLLASSFSGGDEHPKDFETDTVQKYYMYYYDGYNKKLVRCLIERNLSPSAESTLFFSLDSFDRPGECRDFYVGKAYASSPYIKFLFQNANNEVESLFVVAKEPFKKTGVRKGILTGISYRVFQPASSKILISEYELEEDDTLNKWLIFSKDDFAEFRRHNIFVLSEDYESFSPKNSRGVSIK